MFIRDTSLTAWQHVRQGGPDDVMDSAGQTEGMGAPAGGMQGGGDGASSHVTASTPDEFALLKQRTHVRLCFLV